MKTRNLINTIGMFVLGAFTAFAGPAGDMEDLYKAKDYPAALKLIPAAIADKPKDEDVYVIAGDVYFELVMPDSALLMYKKANELESDNNSIRRKLAKAYSEVGKHNEALELLNKAIKDDKKDVLNYLSLGQAYIKAGDLTKADLEIRKAQKMDEKLAEGWIALADLYFAQKVNALAIDYYKKALELDESNIDARINLATSLWNTARTEEDKDLKNEYYSQSLSEWEKVAIKDPKNAKAFWEAGKIYYYSELWKEAAIYLNKYVTLRPDHSIARYYLVESLYKISQCEALQENAKIVIREIDSVKVRVQEWEAECLYNQQKYPEAIAAYNNLRTQVPSLSADQLENISKSYMYSGDTVMALKSYRDVIKVDSKRPFTLMAFGTMAFSMKDYATAAEFLKVRDANITDSLSPKMRYYLGLALLFANNGSDLEASKVFEKVIAEDQTNYSAMVYLSDCYIKIAAKDSARTILNDAITKMSSNVTANESTLKNAFQKLCSMYLQEKNFKEMGKVGKAWTELMPNSQPAYFFFGLSFHGNGEKDGACRNYKKVISIDSQSELAKNAKKYISDLKCNE